MKIMSKYFSLGMRVKYNEFLNLNKTRADFSEESLCDFSPSPFDLSLYGSEVFLDPLEHLEVKCRFVAEIACRVPLSQCHR